MNLGTIREKLERVPVMPLLGLYIAYLGYEYYMFTSDPGSPLIIKQKELSSAREDLNKVKDRVKKANEFFLTLNAKKAQLRSLAQQLEETKSSLSESIDVPELMKTLLIEAKRAGLEVTGLRPRGSKAQEYYVEQDFEFTSSGIFFQYMMFFDRIANLQRIVRVDNFAFKPTSTPDSKYIQLQGTMQLKAYRYQGSKADELAKPETGAPAKPSAGTAPAGGGA